MKLNRKLITAAIAIVITAAVGIFIYTRQLPSAATESARHAAGEVIFQASFDDLHGKSQALAQWQGKILVLNFWATWCPPCLAEIPEFIRLQQEYGKQGVQFIGIAIDRKSKVQAYAEAAGMNYPVLLGDLPGIELSRRIGNIGGGLPYTVIVDRSGNIASTQLGLLSQEKLEAIIKPLL